LLFSGIAQSPDRWDLAMQDTGALFHLIAAYVDWPPACSCLTIELQMIRRT
jgi:hypothetical protein